MGPVARNLTTAWEAGLEIGGAVKQRPGVLRDLKGKRVDNGWGWGTQRTLRESDATPLIELGDLTLDFITTPQDTALIGVDGFKRKFPKAKARQVRSLMKAREALCLVTAHDNKPATLAEATKHTPRKTNPLKRSWRAQKKGSDAAEQTPFEVALRGPRKKQKARTQQAATPISPPANQEEEQAVRLHKCQTVGGNRQYSYLVEWADTRTDGHKVKRLPNHNVVTTPKKGGRREEIERVVEERRNDQQTIEYKVKRVKTWEPAAYLIPKTGGASPLIVEYHQEKMASGNMDGGTRERGGAMACDPDTTTTHDEEAHRQLNRLLTILTTDANPDKDVLVTGSATIHATADGNEGIGTITVYDDKGRHMGQLTQARIAQLHRRYTKHTQDHRDDPPDTFPEELARRMHWYKTGSTTEKSATGKVKMTNHWTLPEEYKKAMHNTMGTVRERFASPLNVNE
jgi:hypothetical protein